MEKSLNAAQACEQIIVNKVNSYIELVIEKGGSAELEDYIWKYYGRRDTILKSEAIDLLEKEPEVKRRLEDLGYKIESTTFQDLMVTKTGFFVDTKENVTLRKLTISACCGE